MPRVCEKCGFYAAEDGPKTGCPVCGRPLRFTLLPPPGEEPKPVPGVPTVLTNRYGNNPELVDAGHATPPSLLSGYVDWKYSGLVAFTFVVLSALLILTIVTTR
jgi:hypothetical protein